MPTPLADKMSTSGTSYRSFKERLAQRDSLEKLTIQGGPRILSQRTTLLAPGTLKKAQYWQSLFEQFNAVALGLPQRTKPSPWSVVAFFDAFLDSLDQPPSRGHLNRGLFFILKAAGQHEPFSPPRELFLSIEALFNQATVDGRLRTGPLRQQGRIGFATLDRMLWSHLTFKLDQGTPSWCLAVQTHLLAITLSTLSCRIGDVAVATDYGKKDCLWWSDIDIRVASSYRTLDDMPKALRGVVLLRNCKGKRHANGSRKVAVAPLELHPHIDFIAWLMVHGRRQRVLSGTSSVHDLCIQAAGREDGRIQWQKDGPVFLAWSPTGGVLAPSALHVSGAYAELTDFMRSSGVLCDLTPHAFRLGSASDTNHLPDQVLTQGGFQSQATRQVLNLPNNLSGSALVEWLGGEPSVATMGLRAEYANLQHLQLPFAAQGWECPRHSKADFDAYFQAWDAAETAPSVTAADAHADGKVFAGRTRSIREIKRARRSMKKGKWRQFLATTQASTTTDSGTIIRPELLATAAAADQSAVVVEEGDGHGTNDIVMADGGVSGEQEEEDEEDDDDGEDEDSEDNGDDADADDDDDDDDDDDWEDWLTAQAHPQGPVSHPGRPATNMADLVSFYSCVNVRRMCPENLPTHIALPCQLIADGLATSTLPPTPFLFKCDGALSNGVRCDQTFAQKSALDRHKLSCRRSLEHALLPQKPRRHVCHVCGHALQSPAKLRLHLDTHDKDKQPSGKSRQYLCMHPDCAGNQMAQTSNGYRTHLQKVHSIDPGDFDLYMPKHVKPTWNVMKLCAVEGCVKQKGFASEGRFKEHCRNVHKHLAASDIDALAEDFKHRRQVGVRQDITESARKRRCRLDAMGP